MPGSGVYEQQQMPGSGGYSAQQLPVGYEQQQATTATATFTAERRAALGSIAALFAHPESYGVAVGTRLLQMPGFNLQSAEFEASALKRPKGPLSNVSFGTPTPAYSVPAAGGGGQPPATFGHAGGGWGGA